MRDFKVLVKKQGSSEWGRLDMYGDTDVNVILNIKDIREPQSIKTNYTKTFEVPATHNNDQFFGGLFEQGFYPTTFDPNKKVLAQLMMDDQIIIDGYIQVDSINKNGGINSYSIIIYGETSNLFTVVGDAELRDLDFSEYSHNWTLTNIKNSWDTSIIRNGKTIPYLKGRGYVYPYEWRGQSDVSVMNVEDFFPSIYIKEIIDKIFRNYGITYQSEFFNSTLFKSLILNYNKSHIYLDGNQKALREFSAKRTTRLGVATMYPTIAKSSGNFTIPFDTEVHDPSNLFDGKYFTPQNKQYSSLGGKVRLMVRFTPNKSPGSPWVIVGKNMTANVWLYDFTDKKLMASEIAEFVHPTGTLFGNNAEVYSEVFVDYSGILDANHKYGIIVNFTVPKGPAESKFITPTGAIIGGTIGCYVEDTSEYLSTIEQNWIYENDIIDFKQIIPEDVKIKDFLTSISKMFNLYWLPLGGNKFRIEPRDTLYSGGDIRDWTGKLDNNETVTITPMAELNNKTYYFTYAEDDDYYNTKYISDFNNIYGSKRVEVDNDFVTNESKVDLIFSPSPLSIREGDDTKVMNTYVQMVDGYFEGFDGKPKISYWGGLKDCSQWTFNTSLGTSQTFTKYPYAGHFDDPYNPTVDLMWSGTKKYFYKWTKSVPNNLWNTYWRNWTYDIINKDSHILTGTVHLKTNDIINLSLLDTIQLNEVYYKINNIKYNPLTETADIELFKANTFGFKPLTALPKSAPGQLKPAPSPWTPPVYPPWIDPTIWNPPTSWEDDETFLRPPYRPYRPNWTVFEEPTTIQPYRGGGYWEELNNDDFLIREPLYNSNSFGFDNTYKDWNNNVYDRGSFIQVSGKDNYVNSGALNVGIRGDRNRVSRGAKNVNITGNNNFVEAGVQNVTIVGDNHYVVQSNVSYVNGSKYSENGFTKTSINLIRGGINEVQNTYINPTLPNYIKGGHNAVINKGSNTDINYVRSNEDGGNATYVWV